MSTRSSKLALASGSTLVGLALALYLWTQRPEPNTVVLVDNRVEVNALLRENQAASPAIDRALAAEELIRRPITEEEARTLYSGLRVPKKNTPFDPHTYYWNAHDYTASVRFKEHPDSVLEIRTNDLGFRKSVDVRSEKPDLRILATGDSHTAGVVQNHEQFVNLLEAQLAKAAPNRTIEGLNAGKGAYDFYNYVGVLEKFLDLDPDVFVVAVYGGNDFVGGMNTIRFFNELGPRLPRDKPKRRLQANLAKLGVSVSSQDLNQVLYFWNYPEEIEFAAAIARQSLTMIQRLCDENDIELLLVYIPPCREVQPEHLIQVIEYFATTLELTPDELGVTTRLADRMLAFAMERGIECIDMRPIYAASEEACYWRTDLHINTLGHRLIADELHARLEDRLAR